MGEVGIGAGAVADYLRDPVAIYRESFARIRAETNLSPLPEGLREVVVRLVHACGMPEIVADLVWSPTIVTAVQTALTAGAPILVDVEMVAHGICCRPGNRVLCTLNDPVVATLARKLGTTRSAAAVVLWQEKLAGAVVAIGNAPTALFHLLERLAAGGPRPAAILGFPVGFVGAVEAKEALIHQAVPYLTLCGRRGGSALAAAAVNAFMELAGVNKSDSEGLSTDGC